MALSINEKTIQVQYDIAKSPNQKHTKNTGTPPHLSFVKSFL